jgi:hypothetical protein
MRPPEEFGAKGNHLATLRRRDMGLWVDALQTGCQV